MPCLYVFKLQFKNDFWHLKSVPLKSGFNSEFRAMNLTSGLLFESSRSGSVSVLQRMSLFSSNFTNINPAFDTQSDDSNYSYQPICILKNSQKIFGKKFIVSLGKSVTLNNILLSWTKNGYILLIVEALWASTICTYQNFSCRLNQSLCSSVLTLIRNFQLNRYHYNI